MASGDTLVTFAALDGEPPSSNHATLDLRNLHPVLDFDTTTQETAFFTGVMPTQYGGGSVSVRLHWAATSATSGTIGWVVAFERMADGGHDIDADDFASDQTITAAAVPGTSGIIKRTSVTVTAGNADSIVAGDVFRLRVRRDVANDNAAGDAELIAVEIREA